MAQTRPDFLDEEKNFKWAGKYKINIKNKPLVELIDIIGKDFYIKEIETGTDIYQDTRPRKGAFSSKKGYYSFRMKDPISGKIKSVANLNPLKEREEKGTIKIHNLTSTTTKRKRKQIKDDKDQLNVSLSGPTTAHERAQKAKKQKSKRHKRKSIKDYKDQLNVTLSLDSDINFKCLGNYKEDYKTRYISYKIIRENDSTIDIAYIKKGTKIYKDQRVTQEFSPSTGYIRFQMEDPDTKERFLVSTSPILKKYNKPLQIYNENHTYIKTLEVGKKKTKHAKTSEVKSASLPTVLSPTPILVSEPPVSAPTLQPVASQEIAKAKELLLPPNSANFIERQKSVYLTYLYSYKEEETDKRIDFCHEIIEVMHHKMGIQDKNLTIETSVYNSYLTLAEFFLEVAEQLQSTSTYLSQQPSLSTAPISTVPSGLFYQQRTPHHQSPNPTLTLFRAPK